MSLAVKRRRCAQKPSGGEGPLSAAAMPKHFYHMKPFPVLDTPFHHTPGFCPAPGGPGVGPQNAEKGTSALVPAKSQNRVP